MALYNAWCDRVPVYVVVGNTMAAELRRPGIEWNHTAQDQGAVVRDFTKWDDNPASLQHFAESSVRAYKIAMTPPTAPVLIVADGALQEDPIPAGLDLRIPKLPKVAPPQGDPAAVAETARLLVSAENPVLIADRYARSPAGAQHLAELAEALQCPVIDTSGRLNLASRHPLNQSSRARQNISQADIVLGLEMSDFWGSINSYRDQLHRTSRPLMKDGAKAISLGCGDLYTKSNYQDFQRFADVDTAITGDGEATMPSLIEAVKRLVNAGQKSKFEARGKKLADAHHADLLRARSDATYGWDASPISTARLSMEIYNQIKDLDFSLVSSSGNVSGWPNRLWRMEKHHSWLGSSGGAGVGYGAPASVGAALGNRDIGGRFSVNIQSDGDLMYAPGVLWTAARHKIPILSVMHNNRGYHQEVMHLQRLANRRNRVAALGMDRSPIGTSIENPDIDFAGLAKSMGYWTAGPIKDPDQLGPTIKKAVEVVKAGEPALIDVWTQPR
jgi:thiamine pyrophosphate-dependent acetolactate synthase large subunit-like protein